MQILRSGRWSEIPTPSFATEGSPVRCRVTTVPTVHSGLLRELSFSYSAPCGWCFSLLFSAVPALGGCKPPADGKQAVRLRVINAQGGPARRGHPVPAPAHPRRPPEPHRLAPSSAAFLTVSLRARALPLPPRSAVGTACEGIKCPPAPRASCPAGGHRIRGQAIPVTPCTTASPSLPGHTLLPLLVAE